MPTRSASEQRQQSSVEKSDLAKTSPDGTAISGTNGRSANPKYYSGRIRQRTRLVKGLVLIEL